MKNKIVMSAIVALLLSVGVSTVAGAAPYRGYHRGYYRPRVTVRVCPPPVPVFVPRVRVIAPAPVVYRGGYCRPHYYAHSYGYRHCGPHRYCR